MYLSYRESIIRGFFLYRVRPEYFSSTFEVRIRFYSANAVRTSMLFHLSKIQKKIYNPIKRYKDSIQ